MWCIACGAELPRDAVVCWICGQAQATPSSAPDWESCEIVDREALIEIDGLVRCHRFVARARGGRGHYQAGQSGGFYCPDWLPEHQYAEKEHAELVARLIREGWEPTGECGSHWWNLQFRRPVRVSRPAVRRAEKMAA
jgi:hypothetical protein